MPRRASLPEGKSLFFRQPPEEGESQLAPDPVEVRPTKALDRPSKPVTRQSAIFLEERHLDWLEDKCREARQRGGRAIRKALIIRALLDVAMESPIDITSIRNDEDLIDRLRQGLRRT